MADCDFNQAALHPAYPIKRRTSTQRTQASEIVDTPKSLSPLTGIDPPCTAADDGGTIVPREFASAPPDGGSAKCEASKNVGLAQKFLSTHAATYNTFYVQPPSHVSSVIPRATCRGDDHVARGSRRGLSIRKA
jgi:hypothetical protein